MSSPNARIPAAAKPVPSRRDFLTTSAAAMAAVSTGMSPLPGQPRRGDRPETLVAELYRSFNESQILHLTFPFDHPLRHKVDNNWCITYTLERSLSEAQRAIVYDIVSGLHSERYAKQVMRQIETDNGGDSGRGFGHCSIAMFGKPTDPEYEFVFSGRHVTRRCDGNSVRGAAFGGPIFYGHEGEGFREKPDHPGNLYWYQARRANEVFAALDGPQRAQALRSDPRPERGTQTVHLSGRNTGLVGLAVGAMTADQKALVRQVMADLLAPFRKFDREETMRLVELGGFDDLHLSFYKNLDIGGDGIWDVWQIEGPEMVWYFRGHPHVHVWVNVRKPRRRRLI
jgi:hypothetical protein